MAFLKSTMVLNWKCSSIVNWSETNINLYEIFENFQVNVISTNSPGNIFFFVFFVVPNVLKYTDSFKWEN